MDKNLKIFKALADDTRFKILDSLLKYDLCVGALAGHLGISKAAVSQHLQVLRKAGLVKGEKRGYWTHYMVERDVLHRTADDLSKIAEQPPTEENICIKAMGCHGVEQGKEVMTMCEGHCEHPEKLKGKPGECTPAQIKECHGDVKSHPCKDKD